MAITAIGCNRKLEAENGKYDSPQSSNYLHYTRVTSKYSKCHKN